MLLLGFVLGTLFGFFIAAILDASRNGVYDSGESGELEYSAMVRAARGLAALRILKMVPGNGEYSDPLSRP